MPSQQHEILVELFRNRPQLACELLERVARVRIAEGVAELASSDLSQSLAVEYRADAVTVVRAHGRIEAATIVEVQLHNDRDKRRTWPLYVAALRARLHCPVALLVVAPDPAVARWARTPIPLGHPGFELRPIVVSFADLPRTTDRDLARAAPELGILSVMAHRDLEVARVVASEVLALSEDKRQVYLDLIYSALPAAAETTLKEWLMHKHGYQYQSNVVREYIAQGREEGREQGMRAAILEFARGRLGTLPAAYEAAVLAIEAEAELTSLVAELGRARDDTQLRELFDRLVTASER